MPPSGVTVNDYELASFAQCPLYWPGKQPTYILEQAGADALSWGSHQEFLQGHPPSRAEIRDRIEKEWVLYIPSNHPKYNWGLSLIKYAAARIHEFLRQHTVIRPVGITRIPLKGGDILTSYGLWKPRYSDEYLRRNGRGNIEARKRAIVACPIDFRTGDREHRKAPDVRQLAVHLAAARENATLNIAQWVIPMVFGETRKRGTLNDWVLAEQYLQGILDMYLTGAKYPVPGEHCKTCTPRPCERVYGTDSGRDDDSEQEGPLASLLRG